MAIELKPHNVETLKKVKEKYKESRRVAIVHPMGTGKSIIALKLIEENKGKKAIYVAPSNSILHNVKKDIFEAGMNMTHFQNLKRMTYQKLAKLTKKEIQELDADLIILDEFHHCGAEKWGKGVERLLDRNPDANILGLSATPIRYFDGLRDMSDELFDGNVASEMTLEEAIVKGILPKAKYVSALYGYEEELKNMLEKIEKIKDPAKRKQAEELFNRMSKRLSEETKNLPQLLANNMTNKSGKYIVFCKNIDDMREKMEKAQEMFGQVNSNIKVRSVSSDEDIKKNERMLTEFEKDNEEGSLKLLFAVNMLNEGYHIKDLDGVVMMRPTYSPTIYAQQLGRALSVGNGKEPVIIDLVNNFDSCKIIEDFAERMKQYEKSGERRKDNLKAKSRLSIFDKTQEFRNIAQKITDILSTTKVSLEDKIDIFEEFLANNDEEITGTTMYEGYPIGQWAIQIRSSLKRNDNKINPTDEQLERLQNLGILESQIESTIDEKIESMAEWVKKYPYARLVNLKNVEATLKEYSSSDKEYENLLEEYKKMQSYYDYARYRKSQGKLTDEQLENAKNANLGGVFGYSDEIEELSQKYGYGENDVIYLLNKYGTIENYHRLYLKQEIKNEYDLGLVNIEINNFVDVHGNPNPQGYNTLLKWIIGSYDKKDIFIYSSEIINEKINQLTERERIVIERRYDLNGEGLSKDFERIGLELGLSRERIRQIEAKAFKKLRYRVGVRKRKNIFELNDLKELMTEEEKKEYSHLDDDITDVMLEMKTSQDEDIKRDLEVLKKVMEEFKERSEKRQQEEKKMEIEETRQRIIDGTISMREIGLSDKIVEALNALEIKSIKEFSNNTIAEIKKKTGLDYSYITQIMKIIDMYNLYMKKPEEVFELKIEELGLSGWLYKCLARAGLNTVGDILVKSEEDIIENFGMNLFNEVCEKIAPYKGLIQEELEKKQQEEMNQDIFEEDYFDEITIEELDLSTRAFNILYRGGYRNLRQLLNLTELELKRIRNMGKKSFEDIVEKIEPYRVEYETQQKKKIEETRQRIIDGTISMKELGFSDKIIEALNASGIKSITEFSKNTGRQIMLKTGLDLISANNIIKLLRKLNLHEKMPDEIPIEELGLSSIVCHWLQQSGHNMLEDLMNISESDLMRMNNLGPKRVEEIMSKLEPYREQYKTQIEDNKKLEEQQRKVEEQRKLEEYKKLEEQQEKIEFENTKQALLNGNLLIEKLDLSVRYYNCVKRRGYNTVDELLNLTEGELLKIRYLGRKGAEEIMEKLVPYRKMIVEAERQKEELNVQQEDKTQIITEENDFAEMFVEDKGEVFFEDEEDDFWDEEELEPETLEEEKVEEKPIVKTEQKSTDLQSAKAKREELQERINQLKSQMNQAQSLLDECNEILGDRKEDKKPSIDD